MNALRKIRQEKGYTLESAASLCGIPRSTYQQYEVGFRLLPSSAVESISNGLSLTENERSNLFFPERFSICDM